MTELFYLYIYLFSMLFIGIQTLCTKMSLGEVSSFIINLPRIEIALLILLNCVIFFIAYVFYRKTHRKMPVYTGKIKYTFHPRIHFAMTLLLAFQIWGASMNINTLNSSMMGATASHTAIFSLLKVDQFFPIYYIIARDTKKKLYWVNVVLFSIMKIMQGWSGFILTIAIYELYFLEKKYLKKIPVKQRHPALIVLTSGLLLLGGAVYKFMYPLKNYIRYGGTVSFDFFNVTYGEALNKLLARLTYFPVSIVGIQNVEKIVELYHRQNVLFPEIKSFFRPLVPSFLMDKNFRPIGNLVKQSFMPDLPISTSADMGILAYLYDMFFCDISEFVLYLVIVVFLFILSTTILYMFDNADHDIRILYFLLVMKVIYTATPMGCFANGYVGAIYMIVILRICGVIKRGSQGCMIKRRD